MESEISTLETEKLKLEIRELRWGHYRALAVSLSVVIGIMVAVFKAWGTLTDIQAREQAARSEAILRSSNLVLELTGPLSGYRVSNVERDANKNIVRFTKEQYPIGTVRSAIAMSIPVAKQFPEMCEPLNAGLTELSDRGYKQAEDALVKLKNDHICFK